MFMFDKKSDINNISITSVKSNEVLINWIGQAGFVIKSSEGTVVCLDPYYSNSVERYDGRSSRRMWQNRFIIENFKPNLVLCSHDHLDHTDPETLPLIYSYSDAIFYGSRSSFQHMKKMKFSDQRLKKLENNREYVYKDIKIKTVYAKHTDDSLGFIFIIDDIKIYFTCDTGLDEKLYKLKDSDIDIMVSCINGKYGNLSIEEALDLYSIIKPGLLIPMHYGLITDNTVNINYFIEKCSNKGVNYLIMDVEKDYFFKKEPNNLIKYY